MVSRDTRAHARDLGLLSLRVLVSGFMLSHGLPKVLRFEALWTRFSDPLGVGSGPSLLLAIFAEVGCSVLLIAGISTRLAAIPPLVTMLVAAFVVHAHDPWAKQEFALLYAQIYLAIILLGPGRFSVDHRFGRR